MDKQSYSEQDIPILDDSDELALDCETVEDYCARWRSVAEAMADEGN